MQLVLLNEKEYKNFTIKHNAHFLQSYEWGELSKKNNFIPFYVGLKDGNSKILATALLLQKKLVLGYSYFYIPRGYTIDYHNQELLKEMTLKIKEFIKEKKGIYFKIDPDIKLQTIDENAEVIEGDNNYELVAYLKKIGFKHLKLTKLFETWQPRYTFRVDLTKDLEEIRKNYHPKARSFIKKAEDYQIEVKEGTRDDIKEFVRLMKLTEKRQDFYSHNEAYYYDCYDTFTKENHLKLLLGEIDLEKIITAIDLKISKVKTAKNIDTKQLEKLEQEKKFYQEKLKIGENKKVIVNACIMINYGNKTWYLYGANDMEYKNAYANYKTFDYHIKSSHDGKIQIFDLFGTIGDLKSNNHLQGIHDFKRKWGGEYLEFIGEFDYVLNPLMYFVYKTLIPIRHKIINKRLRSK